VNESGIFYKINILFALNCPRRIVRTPLLGGADLQVRIVWAVICPNIVLSLLRSFNAQSGNDVLAVQRISQAQALQREGRANRQAPGTAYKTYTEAEFNKLPVKTVPEIQRFVDV